MASITAHVAAESALAVIRCSRGTTSGRSAVRAGSKNAVATTPRPTSTNASQMSSAERTSTSAPKSTALARSAAIISDRRER